MAHPVPNQEITRLLRLISDVYAALEKNPFSVSAYRNTAETVEKLDRSLYAIWQDGCMREISGLKGSIGDYIHELFSIGRSKHFDEVLAAVPPSFFVLVDVPSIGPKKAYKLIEALKVYAKETVLEDVIQAAEEGKIAPIPFFGEKSQKDIKKAVEIYRASQHKKERMPYPVARQIATEIIAYLSQHPAVQQVNELGSLRRKVATIGDVDLAVVAEKKDSKAIFDHFVVMPGVLSINNAGKTKASIQYLPNVRVDLRIQEKESYGSMLQYFTGSKSHNIALRKYAQSMGYSLSEYGIKVVDRTKVPKPNLSSSFINKEGLYTFPDEEGFYNFLGLSYIPPEIREGTDEIEKARQSSLPTLLAEKNIQGDFHIHSSYDIVSSHDVGVHTYKEIIKKAEELGYSYLGFTDHNPRQSGHTDKDIISILKKRKKHIDTVLKHGKIPYYIGLEVDIMPDGNLAIPTEATNYLDYVVASVHSAFNQSKVDATNRLLRALEFPKVRVLGHPTGRVINKREGVYADWGAVFRRAFDCYVALEINASPIRMDLSDSLVHQALGHGCIFIINSDAHDIKAMENISYGVSVARRGWLEKDNVVNTWGKTAVKNWLEFS